MPETKGESMTNFFSPFAPAIERTSQLLFRPFDIGRWFALGFSAWLASFISNAGAGYSSYSPFDHADGDPETWNFVLRMGLPTWLAIVLGVGLLVWLLTALISWLGCRGKFMFLDNVLHSRCEVVAPWKAFRRLGNSFFCVYFLVVSICYALCLALIMFAMVFLWSDLEAKRVHDFAHYLPLIIAGGVFLLISITASIFLFFLREFGVLWMYRHGETAWKASHRITSLATEQPLHFILYLLIRLGIAVVLLMVIGVIACLTCCVSIIPYIGSVITLPLSVFLVWYNLSCFAQFGPEYDVRQIAEMPPALPPNLQA